MKTIKINCIEITSMPKGEAPEEVKKHWIGLKIPSLVEEPLDTLVRFPQSGKTGIWHGYWAPSYEAVAILATKDENAAKWFITNWPNCLLPDNVWAFDSECCHLVEASQINIGDLIEKGANFILALLSSRRKTTAPN